FYDGSVAKDRLSSDLFGWADVDLISPADSGEKSTCEWPLSYLCEIVAVDGRDAAAPPAASSPRLLKSPIKVLILLVPGEGFEPPTFGLQNRCTAAVLTRPIPGNFSLLVEFYKAHKT